MAQIKPFKGTLYDAAAGLSSVLAPPYDIIGSALQDDLYERNPYNIVRLILGYIHESDTPEDNRYTRAAADFADWKERGILRADVSPAIYLYDQEFELEGERRTRRGFIALLRLEDFSAKGVHPHEVTYAEPRADRLSLLRACRAYFSQVFALYSDEEREVETALWNAADAEPLVDFTDDSGIRNILRRVDDPEALRAAEGLMAGKQLFIADGHHRYETALLYQREMREEGGPGGDAPYDFVPTFFVSAQNPGLVILPVHRVIPASCCGQEEAESALAASLSVERISERLAEEPLEELASWMDGAGRGEHRFGLVAPHGLFTLRLQDKRALASLVEAGHSEEWSKLDVSVIQELGIKRCLSADELAREGSIKYVTDAGDAMEEVRAGRACLAFLVRPTTVEDIKNIALRGEKMPPKSSYFHPKPLSGIVIYDHATAMDA